MSMPCVLVVCISLVTFMRGLSILKRLRIVRSPSCLRFFSLFTAPIGRPAKGLFLFLPSTISQPPSSLVLCWLLAGMAPALLVLMNPGRILSGVAIGNNLGLGARACFALQLRRAVCRPGGMIATSARCASPATYLWVVCAFVRPVSSSTMTAFLRCRADPARVSVFLTGKALYNSTLRLERLCRLQAHSVDYAFQDDAVRMFSTGVRGCFAW